MATTKKSTETKRTTTDKKAAPAKKPAAKTTPKAAPKKRTTTKRATAKVAKPVSFRLSRESQSFISTRITTQTVYWSILAIVILVLGIYVINIQLDILRTLQDLSDNAMGIL
jgi:hypothetical protein